jgi:hypothetical protein
LGQCLLSPGFSLPLADPLPLIDLPLLPAGLIFTQTLPLCSLLISHVAYSPSLPVLILLIISDWWLSLQPPAHAGSPLADFSTLKMEAICYSETSANITSTQRHIPEDDILHSHRCENLISYNRYIDCRAFHFG